MALGDGGRGASYWLASSSTARCGKGVAGAGEGRGCGMAHSTVQCSAVQYHCHDNGQTPNGVNAPAELCASEHLRAKAEWHNAAQRSAPRSPTSAGWVLLSESPVGQGSRVWSLLLRAANQPRILHFEFLRESPFASVTTSSNPSVSLRAFRPVVPRRARCDSRLSIHRRSPVGRAQEAAGVVRVREETLGLVRARDRQRISQGQSFNAPRRAACRKWPGCHRPSPARRLDAGHSSVTCPPSPRPVVLEERRSDTIISIPFRR